MPESNPVVKGVSTIAWSTGGRLSLPTTMILESIDVRPRNKGPLSETENNNGKRVAQVFEGMSEVFDFDFDATVDGVYDEAKTYPKVGEAVTLTIRIGGVGVKAKACVVSSPPAPKFGRKKDATISWDISYSTEIASY
jgi:hypothetical protein